MNSSCVRDIGRDLDISKNTVILELKKTPAEVNQYFMPPADGIEIAITTDADADELLIYVGRKNNKRWAWYAVKRTTGVILAWHNGRRTDESCSRFMAKLSTFPVTRYYTDDW